MDMQGSRMLAVNREQAWQALNDPEMLKACIPGCERFEASDADTYNMTAAIKIGPVAAHFNGRVQLSDIVAPPRLMRTGSLPPEVKASGTGIHSSSSSLGVL